ncbi:MAG TPA: PQQ-binding-like beta-propeller repeat protein [Gemmataceae bacterium]|nr:PQQ-binding-like beta-propeller repeat protein [Gemmataceae bacterium]
MEGDLLIECIGSFPGTSPSSVIAFNRITGKEVWKTPTEGLTNSSPVIVSAAGKRQVIVWTQGSVMALEPATGKLLWQEKMKTSAQDAVTTPVFHNNLLLLSGLMLKLDPDKPAATVLWPDTKAVSRRTLSVTSTALFQDEYLYSAQRSGSLVCLEAATGKKVWETEKVTDPGNEACIHITPNGDSAFLYNDKGELILAHLTPRGFQEVFRTLLLKPFPKTKAWAAAAYANRHVFVRNDEELIGVSLAANP